MKAHQTFAATEEASTNTVPKWAQNLTEEKLLEMAQAGHREAFDILVIEYQSKMYRWAMTMSRSLNVSYSEVADIVQESLLKAWVNLDKFRGDSKLSTWLYSITRNQAINHSKKNRRHDKAHNISEYESIGQDLDGTGGEHLSIENLVIDIDTPDELLLAKEVQRKVMEVIEELPPNLKNIIILREIEQLSYDEISKRTNSKLGTVKTQIHRARDRIDKEMEKWALGNLLEEDDNV